MDILLSAKGDDVTAWGAAKDFTAAYKQALLDRTTSDLTASVETVFSEACVSLDTAIATHQSLMTSLNSLVEEVASSANLRELTATFYGDLYRHFDTFRSAPAFYQLSMAYLRQASAAVIAQTTDQLGLFARYLPEMSLIAVGPAGRGEYSPYCPLQILLVHDEVAASQLQTIDLFCQTLHAQFEEAGFAVDPIVTPRNEKWRGTLAQWQQRCEEGLHPQADNELINLCRLVDQYPLHLTDRFSGELKRISRRALSENRPALTNLVARMAALSNGLGIMGRLKLERSGSERGLFRLIDHGLLPLSAALSSLALIKDSLAISNCERIRDLLKRRELDVELAERMLSAWHNLNNLRLMREQSFRMGEHTDHLLLLDPDELTVDQRHSLKTTLEAVASIQRHVEIIFSGLGE